MHEIKSEGLESDDSKEIDITGFAKEEFEEREAWWDSQQQQWRFGKAHRTSLISELISRVEDPRGYDEERDEIPRIDEDESRVFLEVKKSLGGETQLTFILEYKDRGPRATLYGSKGEYYFSYDGQIHRPTERNPYPWSPDMVTRINAHLQPLGINPNFASRPDIN